MPHVSPFGVAWALTAVYGAALVAAALKIAVKLARTGRYADQDGRGEDAPWVRKHRLPNSRNSGNQRSGWGSGVE